MKSTLVGRKKTEHWEQIKKRIKTRNEEVLLEVKHTDKDPCKT